MKRTRLFGSEIEFDPVATERGYEQIGQPDPSCCDACAAFADVALRRALPVAFTSRLVELGIDPAKPQEVYGTPAVGALAGWYVFVGRLHTIWCGEAESAFAELDPGFRSWVTDRLVVHSWERSPEASGLVQLEFDWRDRGLAEISRASRSRGR